MSGEGVLKLASIPQDGWMWAENLGLRLMVIMKIGC